MIAQQQLQHQHRAGHETYADKHPRRVPRVLIVDDDIQSALIVQSTFRSLGCETEFALTTRDAQRKLSAAIWDIIVLDWMLDKKVSADQVMARAIRRIEKFEILGRRAMARKPKIITYSGLDEGKIHLPNSPFYVHFGHWQKPLLRPEMAKRSLTLLTNLGF